MSLFDFQFSAFRQDRAKAVEILVKDLKVFASFNEELFKEITQLLTLDNFRYCLFAFAGSLSTWQSLNNWSSHSSIVLYHQAK